VPSQSVHLTQVRHNLAFLQSFYTPTTPYADWAVTSRQSLIANRCRYLSWLIATPTCPPFAHSLLANRHSLPFCQSLIASRCRSNGELPTGCLFGGGSRHIG
jgi:hypothetical protein